MPSIPYLPIRSPVADTRQGTLTSIWRKYFERLHSLVRVINTFQGVNRWNLADQPSLGPDDEGYLAFVADYGHQVRWTGTVWEFAPGDCGNLFKRDFLGAPQEVGWQLMDGTLGVTYLVVGGATLTTAAVDMPNLTGTPAFHKSIAAYTGAITAAGGASGSSGAHTHTGPNHTHDMGNHTHAVDPPATNSGTESTSSIPADVNGDGLTETVADYFHTHQTDIASFASGAPSTNTTGASGTGSTSSDGAHTHGIGTLEPIQIGWLPYFRR